MFILYNPYYMVYHMSVLYLQCVLISCIVIPATHAPYNPDLPDWIQYFSYITHPGRSHHDLLQVSTNTLLLHFRVSSIVNPTVSHLLIH